MITKQITALFFILGYSIQIFNSDKPWLQDCSARLREVSCATIECNPCGYGMSKTRKIVAERYHLINPEAQLPSTDFNSRTCGKTACITGMKNLACSSCLLYMAIVSSYMVHYGPIGLQALGSNVHYELAMLSLDVACIPNIGVTAIISSCNILKENTDLNLEFRAIVRKMEKELRIPERTDVSWQRRITKIRTKIHNTCPSTIDSIV